MSTENILWMGDIEPWMNESIIKNYFQYYNINPSNIKIIKDRETKQNKNYCFIYFNNINDSSNALITLNGKKIPNTNINFKLNWADHNSIFSKSLYVRNLNSEVDDIELYKCFKKKYKSVHHASVVTDKGISRGYGFVIFRNEDEYLRSIKEMNGVKLHGNIIKVAERIKKENECKVHFENEKSSKKYDGEIKKNNLNNYTELNKKNNNSNINQNVNSSCININDYTVNNCKNCNNNGISDNNSCFNYFNCKDEIMEFNTNNNNNNKLEILGKVDEMTLMKIINQSINKAWSYYKNLYSVDERKLRCKYFYLLYNFFIL